VNSISTTILVIRVTEIVFQLLLDLISHINLTFKYLNSMKMMLWLFWQQMDSGMRCQERNQLKLLKETIKEETRFAKHYLMVHLTKPLRKKEFPEIS